MATLIEEVEALAALPSPAERHAILSKAGVSISRFAGELGHNRVTVSRWIGGNRTPKGDDLVAFVGLLAEIAEARGATE